MNYDNAFGAEFREVAERERDGQTVRGVVASRVYSTDRADLWNAMTDPERLPRWFLPISGDLKVGGAYQLEGNASGTILRCDAPETLEVTWEYGGQVSWVLVTLTEAAGGTKLTLEHFAPTDDASAEHWNQYGPGATGVGWDLGFLGLALHLDSGGEAIDQEQNTAWMTSEPGKQFMRTSADAWCKAHVDSGEAVAVAEAMAKLTADAYTGA